MGFNSRSQAILTYKYFSDEDDDVDTNNFFYYGLVAVRNWYGC